MGNYTTGIESQRILEPIFFGNGLLCSLFDYYISQLLCKIVVAREVIISGCWQEPAA
jgi:hypothetical protein